MIAVNAWTIVALVGLAGTFAVMYSSMLTKLSRGLVSPYVKVDVRRRLYAAAVDGLLTVSLVTVSWTAGSLSWAALAAAYALLRDSFNGRSVGKFLVGLVVISLETGRPVSWAASTKRNIIFLIPGANVAALVLEARTVMQDPQGQRLGDRVALTQVIDGFGARELARWFSDLLQSVGGQPDVPVGRRRREPARSDRAA